MGSPHESEPDETSEADVFNLQDLFKIRKGVEDFMGQLKVFQVAVIAVTNSQPGEGNGAALGHRGR